MLSSEGNENGEKTTIGLISKKATLHVQHTFFVHFFAVVLHDYCTRWNFQKLPGYTFNGENVVRFLVHYFHCRSFSPWWPLEFLIFPPPLQNFHVVLPTKKCLLYLLSLALAVCSSFSHWASLASRLLSLFLCLSLSLFSKFVDMTINLSQAPV